MNNTDLLRCKLNEIEKIGWINVDSNSLGNIGLKIENLLGVQSNNLEYPDFEGIELKTKIDCNNKFLTLFNATPDNTFFEIKRIHSKFGYPDKNNKSFNVFNISIYNKKQIKLPNYSFQLFIDDINKKLIMLVFDRTGELAESKISWSFEMIKEKFERKFNQFCMIHVIIKRIDNVIFFRIKSFQIYRSRSFENFIELIKNDKIRVTFKIGVFSSGKRSGEIHDRGTGFDLDTVYIEKLFEKVIY